MTRLVFTRQPQVIVLAIHGNMFHVSLGHFLDRVLDGLHADTGRSGVLGGEVGVEACAVPDACRQGFRVERGLRGDGGGVSTRNLKETRAGRTVIPHSSPILNNKNLAIHK